MARAASRNLIRWARGFHFAFDIDGGLNTEFYIYGGFGRTPSWSRRLP